MNILDEENKDFLLNRFKNLIVSKESIEKNRTIIVETISKLINNNYLTLNEIKELAIKNNVLSDLFLDDEDLDDEDLDLQDIDDREDLAEWERLNTDKDYKEGVLSIEVEQGDANYQERIADSYEEDSDNPPQEHFE